MQSDLNTIQVVGRLVGDALVRSLPNGGEVTEFSIAVNHTRKKGDEWIPEVSFFDCEMYRGGESLVEYLRKGKQIAMQGALRQDRWKSSDGSARSRVKVLVWSIQLLGSAAVDEESPKHRNPLDAKTVEHIFG